MKFPPKCRTEKLGMIYTILGSFYSFFNWDGADHRPPIRHRKIPGPWFKPLQMQCIFVSLTYHKIFHLATTVIVHRLISILIIFQKIAHEREKLLQRPASEESKFSLTHLNQMEFPTLINWTSLGIWVVFFIQILKQTVWRLIRCRILQRLIWVCTVCQ